MESKKIIKMALIGCGSHSYHHHGSAMAMFARENPGQIELTAVCDLDSEKCEKFRDEFGFAEIYNDIDQMLDNCQLDAIVCVMPVHLNAQIAAKLLKTGICCIIEKPLGATAAEVAALCELAEKLDAPHMVSMNRRFMPVITAGRKFINGRKLSFIRGQILRDRRLEDSFISATAIHLLDAMVSLAGPLKDFDAKRIESADLKTTWCEAQVKFANCSGSVLIAPSCGLLEESYELFGEGFSVKISSCGEKSGIVECFELGECVYRLELGPQTPQCVKNGALNELTHFIAAIRGDEKFWPCAAHVQNPSNVCFKIAEQFGL